MKCKECGHIKLTAREIKDMLILYELNGVSKRKLARKYGVTWGSINYHIDRASR